MPTIDLTSDLKNSEIKSDNNSKQTINGNSLNIGFDVLALKKQNISNELKTSTTTGISKRFSKNEKEVNLRMNEEIILFFKILVGKYYTLSDHLPL